MREKRYTCGICGKESIGLEAYLKCVSTCGEKIKKEQKEQEEKKRLEEVNAALNRVKQAKAYFEQQLKEFEEKYPEEYKMNFAEDTEECDICGDDCDCSCASKLADKEAYKNESISFTYKDDGKNKPELSATINGKKVSDDALVKLFEDPDAKYLAKLLGIL